MQFNLGLFCRVQNSINEEQKKEIQILQRRLGNLRQEFQDQVAGTARILPDRSLRIRIQIWLWIQLQIRPESEISKILKITCLRNRSAAGLYSFQIISQRSDPFFESGTGSGS
jgi:hypothetical protein